MTPEQIAKLQPFIAIATSKLRYLERELKPGHKLALVVVTPGDPASSLLIASAPVDDVIAALEYQRDKGKVIDDNVRGVS